MDKSICSGSRRDCTGVHGCDDAFRNKGRGILKTLDADLDKIVIGQIDKIEKHPDADKLIICQVNIGTETIQIVTGAPNVKEGDKVPVVLDGGRVAGGHEPGPESGRRSQDQERETPRRGE